MSCPLCGNAVVVNARGTANPESPLYPVGPIQPASTGTGGDNKSWAMSPLDKIAALTAERDKALAKITAMEDTHMKRVIERDRFRAIVQRFVDGEEIHEDGCEEDDTCKCAFAKEINSAFR